VSFIKEKLSQTQTKLTTWNSRGYMREQVFEPAPAPLPSLATAHIQTNKSSCLSNGNEVRDSGFEDVYLKNAKQLNRSLVKVVLCRFGFPFQ